MPLTTAKIGELNNKRVNNILEVIIAYARLEFDQKTEVIGNNDVLDAIATGVNMLGEELQNSNLSLKEKEQMLKEIHHRVKNNLQIVSSLLNLQTENVYDASFLNLIIASRNRINSMALVHEMLYSSKDLRRIEVKEYIQRLSQNIYESLSQPGSEINFGYDIQNDCFFDIDRMIPVGLILNETITNSLKYAFPKGKGTILVELRYEKKKNILSISDNGVGFPSGFIPEKNPNLGLQLIEMLTAQLDGELQLSHGNGTAYKILFA